MTGRVLFYVQHLLGVGHVNRAAAIARGLTGADLTVDVAFGGMPVPDANFGTATVHQLPPVRARDAHFSRLVDKDDNDIDDAWWENRTTILLDLFRQTQPNIILVEHFPFGRRKFRRELVPLFKKARDAGHCKIVSSVRDILVESTDPAKTAKIVDLAKTWFDRVLVHGDPTVIRLEDTFPAASEIASVLTYTGYVSERRDPPANPTADGYDEIIVSAGGGAVGENLFRTSLEARRNGCLASKTWRFLAGGNLDTDIVEDLRRDLPDNVIVEPARPDFPHLLKHAALSISQAGYNTVMDILLAGCPAIVVPFATGGETEQTFRAEKFEAAGVLKVLKEANLTAGSLARLAEANTQRRSASSFNNTNLTGAATTGTIVAGMID